MCQVECLGCTLMKRTTAEYSPRSEHRQINFQGTDRKLQMIKGFITCEMCVL